MSDDPANSARAEQIAAFLAMSPPRQVPPELRRAARRLTPPIFLAIFGAIFFAMGILAAREFSPWSFLADRQLRSDTAMVIGHVTAVADTKLSINKRRVVRYEFVFQPASGPRMNGVCFTTGRSWRENAAVSVRYRPENPALCCIDGARLSAGDATSALVLLFPLIGGGLIAWVVIARRRMRALLERGFLAEALVSGVEETMVKVNNRYVNKITLQRTDSPDGGALVVKSSLPEVITFARERMNAKQPVFVLYDPAKPKRALLPEAL